TLERTRSLVRLATDVPVPMEWEQWRLREMDVPKLLSLFQEWGFRGLANDLRALQQNQRADQPQLFGGEDFAFGANATAAAQPTANGDGAWPYHNYHLVDTPEKFEAFFAELEKQQAIVFDLETTSLNPIEAEIVGIAMTWKAGEAWYLAVGGP